MAVNYHIRYLEEVVKKHIPALSTTAKRRIKRAIEKRLITNPMDFGKPLQYSLKGHRRLRVGDYRVIYRIEARTKTVIIVAIQHRKQVYEKD